MPTTAVRRRRWTRAEYDQVIETGGFGPEDRIEVLDGELWEMTPQEARHATVCAQVGDVLRTAFGDGFSIRGQSPIALDDVSEPEPDVAVIRGSQFDYLGDHPAVPLLIVEVSASSLSFDRGRKLAAYARNGIAEYWIVNLTAATLEVHRAPTGGAFASVAMLHKGETVTPLHASDAPIPVADILP